MIKANELRLGNIISYGGTDVSIINLEENGIAVYDRHFDRIIASTTMKSFEEFKPIPLTRKWLIKFGFEQHGSGLSKTFNLTHHLVLLPEKDGFYPYLEEEPEMSHQEPQTVFLNKIEFVHKLQNIWFALTEEELTIKESIDDQKYIKGYKCNKCDEEDIPNIIIHPNGSYNCICGGIYEELIIKG